MSRDWCPAELYLVDKAIKKERGHSLRDERIVFVSTNGEPDKPLINEQARAEYPELSFLYSGFDGLYEEHKDNKKAMEIFDQFESILVDVEASFDKSKGEPASKELWKLDDGEFLSQPVDAVVQEWFFGRLDSNFYYSERNNEAFHLYFTDKINDTKEKTIVYEGKEIYGDFQYCCKPSDKPPDDFSIFANILGRNKEGDYVIERFQRYGKFKLNNITIPKSEFHEYYKEIKPDLVKKKDDYER